MYYEKITDNKKITPGEYRVYQGDFVGAWLCQSKDILQGKKYYLTDGKLYLGFCRRNVMEFNVEKAISMYYYGTLCGYQCFIKWRDGRKSRIMLTHSLMKNVINCIKNNNEF